VFFDSFGLKAANETFATVFCGAGRRYPLYVQGNLLPYTGISPVGPNLWEVKSIPKRRYFSGSGPYPLHLR